MLGFVGRRPSCNIKMLVLDNLLKLVDREMDQVNEVLLSIANTASTDLIKIVSNYLIQAGGKRLRPLLVLIIAKAMAYEGKKAIFLAAAVELIHAATLLHDDVIDGSEKRRQLPSANVLWGNKTSILVGDYLFSKAFQLMVKTDSLFILEVLSQASNIIAETEVWQLQVIGNLELSILEYLKLVEGKTATLFAASCKSSAILSQCKDDEISQLNDFGLNLGIVFQIVDDYLDYFASEEILGKKPLQDLEEKKVTLPLIILRDWLKENPATNHTMITEYLRKYLAAKEADDSSLSLIEKDLSFIKSLMQEAKVNEKIISYAQKYGNKAIQAIEKVDFGKNFEIKQNLSYLVLELTKKISISC